MQDGYTGDIGDFGKHGLLRALAGAPVDRPYRLGVVWYRTPDESALGDGGFVQYLLPQAEAKFRPCDPRLYDALRALVMIGNRSLAGIRVREILPPDTIFYESLLSYAGAPRGRRLAIREAWCDQALIATAPCDLVFLDPDNGLRWQPLRGQAVERKSAHIEELRPYCERDQSVVVYHHLGRQPHDEQMAHWARTLLETLGLPHAPIALRFAPRSPRAFFVLPAAAHRATIAHAVGEFLAGPWGSLFPPDQAIGI